jgi:hypothetical protein
MPTRRSTAPRPPAATGCWPTRPPFPPIDLHPRHNDHEPSPFDSG